MKTAVQSEGKKKIGSAEETLFLELLRTCELLSRGPAQVLKKEDVSATQYNVLRILRGASKGLSCGEIGNRMISKDPDITRLLDRLEKRGLVSRCRENEDRRTVMTRITQKGLDVLDRLDGPIQEAHRRQLGHLGRERARALADLLRTCRDATA